MAFDRTKLTARFMDEGRDHAQRLTNGLLLLEQGQGDDDTLNTLFRSAHTIKGSARMMKLAGIAELAHAMEDVLDALRSGTILLDRNLSQLLFQGIDALTDMLGRLASGTSPEAPSSLCRDLKQAAETGEASEPTSSMEKTSVSADAPALSSQARAPGEASPETPVQKGQANQAEYLRINAVKLDDLIRLMGEIISDHGRLRSEVREMRELALAAARHLESSPQPGREDDRSLANVLPEENGTALHLSLRQAARALAEATLMREHLIGELQDTSLKLRMLPLSTVFEPLGRTVRDLAREYGKQIHFLVEGGDTELDRKITEQIGDSLLHMIRNALDHGLENPEERVGAGKSPTGTISLSACYESGGVEIVLRDDGRGLSTEKIREKALVRKMFDAEALGRMSRAEINNLIFLPGFSTSPIITDISGRGVGMDVVRKNIVDELKGSVFLETQEGLGTAFFLRLPLNLAVFPLFLISFGGVIAALPVTSIDEMRFVAAGDLITIVEKKAIRLREQLVPVEDLSAILGFSREAAPSGDKALVVVVRDGETRLGLLVDEIIGREEMVVKPLPRHLQGLRLVIGCAVGKEDGIVNVLHVPEIVRLAGEMGQGGGKPVAEGREPGATILVVDDSVNTREIEKSILEAYGYEVETAEDGQEAWEKSRDRLYDVVVTDVEMPRMDGFTLTMNLRSDQRYKSVPVIMVTSREKEEDKKRGIVAGADAYIVKRAFDQSNLIETIKNLIGR